MERLRRLLKELAPLLIDALMRQEVDPVTENAKQGTHKTVVGRGVIC